LGGLSASVAVAALAAVGQGSLGGGDLLRLVTIEPLGPRPQSSVPRRGDDREGFYYREGFSYLFD
jgi:hypothetical protein